MTGTGLSEWEWPQQGENGRVRIIPVIRISRSRPRWCLPATLFLATFFTTTWVGARMAHNFSQGLPAFTVRDFAVMVEILQHPSRLLDGLPFSLTLLAILLAHELGHLLACRYYGVDATPPYFLPAPTLIGTFGAFIRIKSPIPSRRALFDIGIAGPLAGFALLLPAMAVGLAYSKVVPGIAESGELVFGTPLVQRILERVIFPDVDPVDIYVHPVARAAWVGAFATALNLLPIGQLDGGHILYALAGRYHYALSRLFVLSLVPIGLVYSYSWLVWALILLLLGTRHPPVHDPVRLDPKRKLLAILGFLILVLSFTATPVRLNDGF